MGSEAEIIQKMAGGVVVSLPQDPKGIRAVLAEMVNKRKVLGVYLTTSQPHTRVLEGLKKEGVDVSSLFLLDMAGKQVEGEENVFILRDPSDLTELSVVITEIMENESIGFLAVDSVGGLETYSEAANVKKFLHALVSYMKKLNKTLILFYTGSESKELMNFITQVSDLHSD